MNNPKQAQKYVRNHVILWPLSDNQHFAMIGVREIAPRQYRLVIQEDKLRYPIVELQACIAGLQDEGLKVLYPFPGEDLCFLSDRVDFEGACHAAAWVILEMQKGDGE